MESDSMYSRFCAIAEQGARGKVGPARDDIVKHWPVVEERKVVELADCSRHYKSLNGFMPCDSRIYRQAASDSNYTRTKNYQELWGSDATVRKKKNSKTESKIQKYLWQLLHGGPSTRSNCSRTKSTINRAASESKHSSNRHVILQARFGLLTLLIVSEKNIVYRSKCGRNRSIHSKLEVRETHLIPLNSGSRLSCWIRFQATISAPATWYKLLLSN